MPISVESEISADVVMEKLSSPEALEPFSALGRAVADTARSLAPRYDGPPEEGIIPGELKVEIGSRATRDKLTNAPEVYVFAPWDYGGFMEFGTEHNAASPFMRPAAAQWEGDIEGFLAPSYDRLLR